jgi:hypothetical protein
MLTEKAFNLKHRMSLQTEAVNVLDDGMELAIPHVEKSKIADEASEDGKKFKKSQLIGNIVNRMKTIPKEIQ